MTVSLTSVHTINVQHIAHDIINSSNVHKQAGVLFSKMLIVFPDVGERFLPADSYALSRKMWMLKAYGD